MIIKLLLFLVCLIVVCGRIAFAKSPTTLPSTAPSAMAGALNKARVPHPKPSPVIIEEMTPKELGNFTFDVDNVASIPADVMALDGISIRMRGFMIPLHKDEKIEAFALVCDLFNPEIQQKPPPIQQVVVVNMPEGKPTDYFPDAIVVEGKLHVRDKRASGEADGGKRPVVAAIEVPCGTREPFPMPVELFAHFD
jgi:hypothetical protein